MRILRESGTVEDTRGLPPIETVAYMKKNGEIKAPGKQNERLIQKKGGFSSKKKTFEQWGIQLSYERNMIHTMM